ncbi:AhpC/TSA family protein [Flavobacterium sp. SH_e]|uniref:TlpA disulfide reductase family protein n=1 Tax=Flavobacterium sp. SH_e TaxID=2983767 RepID=UPI0021E4AEAA|nr:TlpA disulfide reductase family protein [Flavobacterium sp. SH_e]MCV2483869.1 AhpC/TSA family protein [Flavobacterium sp. SH_e]
MNKFVTLLLLMFFITINAQKGFKVSGVLEGFKENTIVQIEKQGIIIDSCYLKNKKFQLKGFLDDAPSIVYLYVGKGDETKNLSFFIGNEDVVINAKIQDFPYDVQLQGAKFDKERYLFDQKEKRLMIERDQLVKNMFLLRDQKKWNDSLQNAYWSRKEPYGIIIKIDKELDYIQNEFIRNHINSFYGLSLLNSYKTEIPLNEVKDLLDKVKPELRNSIYFKTIESHVKYPDLKIEDKFYDFSGVDQTEKAVKFSGYFNGKYILLDFSTLYCSWCLKAIPKLDELKNNNSNKLDIVTFYVDKKRKDFEGLVKKHSKDSNVVWDQQGRFSETYAKYKVFGTPTFYLFAPDGKLVEKFDGYSEELGEKIQEIINR